MHQLLFKLDHDPKGRGLRCDGDGLFFGGNALLRRDGEGDFEARSDDELRKTFGSVCGDDTDWDSRIRSVKLVANALNKGDMARAMMTAVLMRVPDPGRAIRIADVDGVLTKAGYDPDEPRDERGRWTNGGGEGATSTSTTFSAAHRDPRIQVATDAMSDAANDPVAEAAVRAAEAERQSRRSQMPQSIDDGLFDDEFERPKPNNTPRLILVAEEENEKDPRFGVGGNRPPPEELIPQRLLQSPAGPAVQFLDNLLDISGPGDDANFEVAQLLERKLLYRIHEIDPSYIHESIEPVYP